MMLSGVKAAQLAARKLDALGRGRGEQQWASEMDSCCSFWRKPKIRAMGSKSKKFISNWHHFILGRRKKLAKY
jgi:hypothetical protein